MCNILAIETSCDDTAVAILSQRRIIANIISSQHIHELYGGVVPELASRAHMQLLVPAVNKALEFAQLPISEIDVIAATQGPGLLGSLMVGFQYAKSLAFSLDIPFIGVDHLQAHILAHFLENNPPSFPFVCLLVSGGHTRLVLVKDYLDHQILGSTLDDAAGETFDKAAKILGLSYPGGPAIAQQALLGNPLRFEFPMPRSAKYDFSFSGIKTALLYFLRDNIATNPDFIAQNLPDICASYQHHIVQYLVGKLTKAAKDCRVKHIAIAGGVAANQYLRAELTATAEKNKWQVHFPQFQYSTDNAAMVAITAHILHEQGVHSGLDSIPYPKAIIA